MDTTLSECQNLVELVGHSLLHDSRLYAFSLRVGFILSYFFVGEIGPGWSMAWKPALWSRLWNSDHSYSMVKRMFNLIPADEKHEHFDGGGLYSNMFQHVSIPDRWKFWVSSYSAPTHLVFLHISKS